MNTFTVLFTVCFVALASADVVQDQKVKAAAACKTKLNVGDDVAAIATKTELPTSENEKCFLECIYEQFNLIKDGKLNPEGAQAWAKAKFGNDQDKLKKSDDLYKKCQDEVNAAPKGNCALGPAYRKCLLTHGKELLQAPASS